MTTPLNILWLMSDEHNPTVTGYAGNPIIQTPMLDALAAESVRFEAAYCTDPICVPSRRGFHSGRMGSNVETGNYEAMGPYFGRMGFKTAWYGKQHWDLLSNAFNDVGTPTIKVSKQRFKAAGMAYPDGTRYVQDANVSNWPATFNEDNIAVEQALAFLDANAGQRFFLGVSLVKPHFPFSIQTEYFTQYADAAIPRPVVTQAMLDNLSSAMKQDRAKFGFAALTDAQCDFARRIYYGMVSYVDAQLGAVLAKLDALGLRQNTVVVYMADHGEMLGGHGIWYKNSFYEGSARVPMIVCAPSYSQGTIVSAPTSTLDLYPTLCELCELYVPESLEGQSLIPLMDGTDNGASRVAFSENKRLSISARMIRTPSFKYCVYEDGQEQLYDMLNDTGETVNMASDSAYSSLKEELRGRALEGWNPEGLFDGGE